MGVFKDLQAMNDRELFLEYDKMLKQSTKVRKQFGAKRGNNNREQQQQYSINNKEEEEVGTGEDINEDTSQRNDSLSY